MSSSLYLQQTLYDYDISSKYTIGTKRPRTAESDLNDVFICSASFPKRYYSDTPEASPCTPESGIDMATSPNNNWQPSSRSRPPMLEGSSSTTTTMLQMYGPQPSIMQHHAENCKHGWSLKIVDEPEENYRARYESEGCRGPMKGRNGGCPTIIVSNSYNNRLISGQVKVELTSADGDPLQCCRLDNNEEGTNLTKPLLSNTKLAFDNLRIRRLKKTESTQSGKGGIISSKGTKSVGRGKQDEKQAHLLFTASLRVADSDEVIILKAISTPIFLNASHDPPDIHRIVPAYGTTGESIAIIGTRMHSPKVTFIYMHQCKEYEVNGEIEKEVSHQNALVVKVPQLPMNNATDLMLDVHIRVMAGKGDRTGREPLKSQTCPFTYIKQGICKDCTRYAHMGYLQRPPPSCTTAPITMVTSNPTYPPPIVTSTNPTYHQSIITSTAQEDVDGILNEVLSSPSQSVVSPPHIPSPFSYPGPTHPPEQYIHMGMGDFDQYLGPPPGPTEALMRGGGVLQASPTPYNNFCNHSTPLSVRFSQNS